MNDNLKENKNIFIKSYGCQMNVYDSNRIKDLFENKGYKIVNKIPIRSINHFLVTTNFPYFSEENIYYSLKILIIAI